MENVRKPFQGIKNVVQFNWPYYVFAAAIILIVLLLKYFYPHRSFLLLIILISVIYFSFISLVITTYVYDFSDLYSLNWLNKIELTNPSKVINIHAGFDELSPLLKDKFPRSMLKVYDFYDPRIHTEASIKRARKSTTPFPETASISAKNFKENNADLIFLFLSAHEIRNDNERITFFQNLHSALNANGKIILTEHLRNRNNFIAYNFGALHFHPRRKWIDTFNHADLTVTQEISITPFITTFILQKNGNPS